MASLEWHRYFDDNDVSNWSIYGFHETWIRQNKDNPRKLRYQKANDVVTKSLRSLINDCEDEVKKQGAAKLLANRASILLWYSRWVLFYTFMEVGGVNC